jgi:hypothetical protein
MQDQNIQRPDNSPDKPRKRPGLIVGITSGLLLAAAFAIQLDPNIVRNLKQGLGNIQCVIPDYDAAIKRLDGKLGYDPLLPLGANLSNNLQQIGAANTLAAMGPIICNGKLNER